MTELENFISGFNKEIQKILRGLITIFESNSCTSSYKTIYIAFDLENEMVAAAYPHETHVEIALALAESHSNSNLKDASHLTWRTLPVSLELYSEEELQKHSFLIAEALTRVQIGERNTNL